MIRVNVKGDFNNIDRFLTRMQKGKIFDSLNEAGRQGTVALASATPKDSGITADSWGYDVRATGSGYSIGWYNSNVSGIYSIVILLQYGHATGTGGYVQGRDFINPAIRPVFDEIADRVWREVTSA